jgi:hypothetical protein
MSFRFNPPVTPIVRTLRTQDAREKREEQYAEGLIGLYPAYRDRLLDWEGSRAPIVAFPAPEEQRRDPDSVLAGLNPDPDAVKLSEAMQIKRDGYISDLVSAGKVVYNKPTYRMQEIRIEDGRILIECGIGTYFDAMGSCASLAEEFFSKAHVPQSLEELPLRSEVHINSADPIADGSTRSAALGTSALIVFRDTKGQYNYLVRRRAEKLPRYPGLLMPIPGFVFQPLEHPDSPKEEFSIVEGVKREYIEELFGAKVPKGQGISSVHEGECLERLLDSGSAELLFTGVAVPLRDLWPEICTLLLIHDSEWSENVKGNNDHKPITANWEYRGKDAFSFEEKGGVPLMTPISESIGPWTRFVDPCSVTLVEGIKVAKEIIAQR